MHSSLQLHLKLSKESVRPSLPTRRIEFMPRPWYVRTTGSCTVVLPVLCPRLLRTRPPSCHYMPLQPSCGCDNRQHVATTSLRACTTLPDGIELIAASDDDDGHSQNTSYNGLLLQYLLYVPHCVLVDYLYPRSDSLPFEMYLELSCWWCLALRFTTVPP